MLLQPKNTAKTTQGCYYKSKQPWHRPFGC